MLRLDAQLWQDQKQIGYSAAVTLIKPFNTCNQQHYLNYSCLSTASCLNQLMSVPSKFCLISFYNGKLKDLSTTWPLNQKVQKKLIQCQIKKFEDTKPTGFRFDFFRLFARFHFEMFIIE